ncbi:Retrovirus-related Pol polyprotein from transposon TNT 1-94 [Araneus ventricosus]|uniref:Retrovirus-related Pol polyprotein from transposon TNT 1-94 n=1 Tax=Araneus ventricosus TaxID=182803 RepID=A0A4Y2ESH1_ARAVE|nr:Retrovirus-related Pol polyprotein from transposon TNT 1-94 [Araneus ventricosus]
MEKLTVPELTSSNYFIWALKMKAALSLKRLFSVIENEKPVGLEGKALSDWSTKNEDAVSYVKLSLSDEQALQYASEDNAKTLWEKIKSNFTGQAEDRKIDAGNELHNLRLCEKEKISDYIARARGLATKCASLGLDVTERELAFYVVRGLTGKYAKIRGIMLGYARERRGYRIYDIEQKCVIEERAIKFNESVKGSKYLNNSPENLWEIDTLINNEDVNVKLKAKSVHLDSNLASADAPLDEIISNIGRQIGRPLGSTKERSEEINQKRILEIEQDLLNRGVRRPERLKEMKNANIVEIPKDYFEAQSNPNWPNWKTAMEDEIESLNKHKIWELVDKPDNTKIVKSKWVYTIKKDSKTPKFKARLVATGFNQVKNVDYLESYSLVVNIDTFHLLIALAAKLNLAVNFFDVKTAYLHSDLEEEVYMTTPPGYEMETEGKVYRLKKSIYGPPQSGRNWYFKLKSELERIGLKEIASDNYVRNDK